MIVLQDAASSTLDGNRDLGSIRGHEGLAPAPGIHYGLHLTVPSPATLVFRLDPDPVLGTHAALVPLATQGRGYVSWTRHGAFAIAVPSSTAIGTYALALRASWDTTASPSGPVLRFVLYDTASELADLDTDKAVVLGILEVVAGPVLSQTVLYAFESVSRSTTVTRRSQGSLRELGTILMDSGEIRSRIRAGSTATVSLGAGATYRAARTLGVTNIDGPTPGQLVTLKTLRVAPMTRVLVCVYGISNTGSFSGLNVRFFDPFGGATDVPFVLGSDYEPIWVEYTTPDQPYAAMDVVISLWGVVDSVALGVVNLDSVSVFVDEYTPLADATAYRGASATQVISALDIPATGDQDGFAFQLRGLQVGGFNLLTLVPPSYTLGDAIGFPTWEDRIANDIPNGVLQGVNQNMTGAYKQRGVLTPMCVAAGIIECDGTAPPAFASTPFNMTGVEFNSGDIRITLPFAFDSGVHPSGSEGVVVSITYECLGGPVLNLITRQSTVTNTGPTSTRITIQSWNATAGADFAYGTDSVKSLVIKVLVHGVPS